MKCFHRRGLNKRKLAKLGDLTILGLAVYAVGLQPSEGSYLLSSLGADV